MILKSDRWIYEKMLKKAFQFEDPKYDTYKKKLEKKSQPKKPEPT
jgi:hypothetical protein